MDPTVAASGGDKKEEDEEAGEGVDPEAVGNMLQVNLEEGDGDNSSKTVEPVDNKPEEEKAPKDVDVPGNSLLSTLLTAAGRSDPYSVLEGHETADKPAIVEEKEDVVDVESDEESKSTAKRGGAKRKRIGSDNDGDSDKEDWLPAEERERKRRRREAEELAEMRRELMMTSEEKIVRDNLSRPFPRYSFEHRRRLASECVLFRPRLQLRDVAKSEKDGDTEKYLSLAQKRLQLRRARESRARQLERRRLQRRGVQDGVRRTYFVVAPAAVPSSPHDTNAPPGKKPPLACPPPPAPPALGDKVPKKVEELRDDKSYVRVNVKALEELLSTLRRYETHAQTMRDIVRESFAIGDEEQEQNEQEHKAEKGDKDPRLHSLLSHLPRPEHARGAPLLSNRGLRLVDLRLLRIALEKAQACACPARTLSLAEVAPQQAQEDLATHLAIVCSRCQKSTVFATSPFCEEFPANYTVNKELMDILGKEAYFKLAQYVQRSDTQGISPRSPSEVFQLVMSVVNVDEANSSNSSSSSSNSSFANGNIPYAPARPIPLPRAPVARVPRPRATYSRGYTPRGAGRGRGGGVPRPPGPSLLGPRPIPVLGPRMPMVPPPATTTRGGPSVRPVATPLLPLPPDLPPAPNPSSLLQPPSSSSSSNGGGVGAALPLGAQVTALAPGTPIMNGADIRYAGISEVNLPKGVYRVNYGPGRSWFLCVREQPPPTAAATAATTSANGVVDEVQAEATAAAAGGAKGKEELVKVLVKRPDGSRKIIFVPRSKVGNLQQVKQHQEEQKRQERNDDEDDDEVQVVGDDPLAL